MLKQSETNVKLVEDNKTLSARLEEFGAKL